MAKRVDPLKAKAAKQKKIAIGLCALFAVVLVVQVPRTLKMLQGPTPVEQVAVETTPTTAADPAAAPAAAPPPSAGAAGLAPPSGEQAPVLADSDQPALAGTGQLLSFERFESKDPFAQQAEPHASSGEPAAAAPAKAAAGDDATTDGEAETPTGITMAPDAPAGSAPGSSGSATTPPPAAPAAATAAATTVAVNGVSEKVVVGGTFPAASPMFELVSTAKDGKSVQIGVAGGSYADGRETIKLVIGKKLVLQNTADGSRFELLLEAVAGFVPPKP